MVRILEFLVFSFLLSFHVCQCVRVLYEPCTYATSLPNNFIYLFFFKKGLQIDLHPFHEFYTVIVNEKLYWTRLGTCDHFMLLLKARTSRSCYCQNNITVRIQWIFTFKFTVISFTSYHSPWEHLYTCRKIIDLTGKNTWSIWTFAERSMQKHSVQSQHRQVQYEVWKQVFLLVHILF